MLVQHQEWKEKVEAEKSLTNLKRGRVEELEDTEEQEVPEKVFREDSPAGTLPRSAEKYQDSTNPSSWSLSSLLLFREVVVEILKKLEDPRDLARAAQVLAEFQELN